MKNKLKILSVGGFTGYGESNTCLHRTWALEDFASVDRIDTSARPFSFYKRIVFKLFKFGINLMLPDSFSVNKQILNKIDKEGYDIIWIDKGLLVNPSTLRLIRKNSPQILIIGYSPDDMSQRHNQSLNFLKSLPLYDYYITTKSYIIEDLKQMGAKEVIFTDNAYEDKFHYPRKLDTNERERLGGDVGFIGVWEEERANSILYLAKNGINVRVWGTGEWSKYKGQFPTLIIEDQALFSEDYSKALSAFKISLCFLRKMNFDLQTTRTMEIPACGGFLLAERTVEHQYLFKEGEEAAFFSTDEELLQMCIHYLKEDTERVAIAAAGLQRCLTSGYSNKRRIKSIIDTIISKKQTTD